MDQPKEGGKARDPAGYAMGPTTNEIAQREDKEEERRAIHLRPLNPTAMAKVDFEL